MMVPSSPLVVRRTSLFVLAAVALVGAERTLAAQAARAQAQPLAAQADVAQHGFTVRYPTGWSMSSDAGVWRLINVPAERLQAAGPESFDQAGQVFVTVEPRRDHADAVRRLEDVRAEYPNARTEFIEVGGWPALQRRVVVDREQPGGAGESEEGDDDGADGSQQPAGQAIQEPHQQMVKPVLLPLKLLRVTTAIAAGSLMIRVEGRLPADAAPGLEATIAAIGRGLTFRIAGDRAQTQRDLARLKSRPPRSAVQPRRSQVRSFAPPAPAARSPRSGPGAARVAAAKLAPMSLVDAGLAQVVINANVSAEPEIAVSTDGQNIVVAQQSRFATSNDGGLTFPFTGTFTTTDGDSSLAFGRSGNFYEGTINSSSTGFNVSTNNGQTFTFLTNAFTCPTSGSNTCPAGFPDQEHIAADRFTTGAGGGDQVYSAWRHLNGNWGIVCSNNGGQAGSWTAGAFFAGDFPRIAVAQDGFVYVVFNQGATISIHRFSSCQSGLTPTAGYPHTVATITTVPCPVPGLDRCNSGNTLASHTVAVDDADPNHLYVAFAQNTVNTATTINEDVIVTDSTDAGVNWPRSVIVSSGVTARRFMPWVCSVGSVAYVSWFDRRAATAASNSLTDYFAGTARVDAANNLVAGPERRVNPAGTQDSQCAAGQGPSSTASWPNSVRANSDSDSCVPQPQLAGRCRNGGGGGSQNPCDFDTTVCPPLETCTQFGRGTPKYGDYNGNACAAGRFYTVWPSAMTLPPTVGLAGRINLLYAALVVAGNQIQIPGPVGFPDTCVGSSALATANVCNTGTTDLHVDPITSSDPQFAVVTPSSGFPVTVAPGSCFPFQVRFAPASPGSKAAVLTVPSDDTVTPSATIPVSGKATQRAIATAIADAGDFGTVPAGAFRDQPLVISNPGGCTLTVTGITSGIPDFQTASVVSFPLHIAPGASIAIPIRFQPTGFGPRSTTLAIGSDDPLVPARQVAVSGVGGQPQIVSSVVDTASFGSVCVGATRDLDVTITNSGTSLLAIGAITSSSPEFLVPQVLSFPIDVAAGTSVEVPIRFAPATPGAKTAAITFASNDPVTPNKVVTMTAETPANELCHPPSFTSVGMSIGPTFGSSRTGDYTFTAQGRHLAPFGEQHNFGVQAQGEFLYYPGRHEGQFDVGVMDRWKKVQFGLYSGFKFAEFGQPKDGGVLGQMSGVVDLLFSSARVSFFGSKGFKDIGLLSTDTTVVFASVPVAGSTAATSRLEHVARVADTLGGGVLFGVAPNDDIEGQLMWLRRQRPTTLSDKVGLMARYTHHFSSRLALFGEVTLNETLVGPTDSGRVVVGFVFGRWTRPTDFSNKHTPLGTEPPRVHFDLDTRSR